MKHNQFVNNTPSNRQSALSEEIIDDYHYKLQRSLLLKTIKKHLLFSKAKQLDIFLTIIKYNNANANQITKISIEEDTTLS
jgi:hypothetical protein